MAQDDLFNQADEGNNPLIDDQTPLAPQDAGDQNYLEQFVGEGKSFHDVEALAKGKHESNEFIERLKKENSEFRKELDKRLTLEEFVDKMNVPSGDPAPSNQDASPGEQGTGNQENTGTLTQEDVKRLLSEEMGTRDGIALRERNLEYVQQKAEELYGHDYKVVFGQRAKELGLGKDFLGNLAQDNPQAFLNIMAMEGTASKARGEQLVTPPTGSQGMERHTSVPPVGAKGWKDYEKLRKSDPRAYFSVKTQNEMHLQAQKLGDAFYN